MEDPPKPYPFGLEGAGSAYQNAVDHLFADHVERDHVTDLYMINPTDSGQPTPVVNMVAVRQLSDDPALPTEYLHNVLNERAPTIIPRAQPRPYRDALLSLWGSGA